MSRTITTRNLATIVTAATLSVTAPTASSNDELIRLSQSDENWVMQCKDYACAHYSKMTDIDADNVERLRPAWSFSTGVLHGHEGGPLVVNGIMYIHTPFPNNTFAFDLERPGEILWEHKPKQDPAARAVACCDVVNRGLAYADGKIFKTLLDGHIVALDAKTGKEIWRMENSDFKVGSTLTIAPFVVKDKVLVGSSGAELGVRGYVTAYDIDTGEMKWRWYATGPDKEMGLAPDFNGKNPHYGQKGLGLRTWEGDTWKIGGGTNWGWYTYDPKLDMFYYGSGKSGPLERDHAPRRQQMDHDHLRARRGYRTRQVRLSKDTP